MKKSPFLFLSAMSLLVFAPGYSFAACGFTPAGDYTCDGGSGPGATGSSHVVDPTEPTGPAISRTGVVVFSAPVSTSLTPEQVKRAYNALDQAMADIEAIPGWEWVDRVEIDDDDEENIYVERGEYYAAKVRPIINTLSPEQVLEWIDNPAHGGSLLSGSGTETQFMGTLIRTMPDPRYSAGGSGQQSSARGSRTAGQRDAEATQDRIQDEIDALKDSMPTSP